MYMFCNITSLLLGFTAWGLAIAAAVSRKRRPGMATASWALCSFSLLSQILCDQHLVNIGDWSAIEDTHYAVTFAAAVLVIVTAVLNVIAMCRKKR